MKDVEGPAINDFSLDGQPDAVVGPLEDADAKAILHGLNGFAHRGLHGVYSLGGTGKPPCRATSTSICNVRIFSIYSFRA